MMSMEIKRFREFIPANFMYQLETSIDEACSPSRINPTSSKQVRYFLVRLNEINFTRTISVS